MCTINQKSHNILLIDSSTSENDLESLKKDFFKIITFDLNSHRILNEKKIIHDFSDKLINLEELKMIDYSCINFCQWYEQNDGNEKLSYENINIGSLFRIEFYNFLIPILKNFIILEKLKNLYPDYTFFCSGELHKICKNLQINSLPVNEKFSDIELTWDKVQFNLTPSISLKISKKNYIKIKNFSKIISNLIIKKNYDINSQNNFGLIEFDPIKYEQIFQASDEFNEMFLLYNRHRPVFHNRKSLKIIKNSRILPFIPSKDNLKINEKIINESYENILKTFNQFLNNDIFFNSFFKLNNNNFWEFLKPNLIKIFESKLLDAIYEIEYAKFFLLKNNLKAIIILSECGFTEQIIIKLAKKFSINIILLQHGIILDNLSSYDYNKVIAGVLPIESNYFFSWGKISSEYMKRLDSLDTNIKLIGSSNLDRIQLKKSKKNNKLKNVLLLTTGPRNQQSVGHHVNIWNEYENTIRQIYSLVSKNNLNLIIKRHPDIAENDFSSELYSDLSDIKISKTDDLTKMIIDSDIVLSLGVSSAVLESQILEKPVISIDAQYDVFGSTDYIPNSCPHVLIGELDNLLSKLVNNSESLNDIIQKGTNSLKNNISNIGNSSRILIDTLTKLQ